MFADAGCRNVRTYIQSGNVVFDAANRGPNIAMLISAAIHKNFGYNIPVVLRTSEELAGVIRENPFLQAGADPKALHVYFLADQPKADAIAGLDMARSKPDAFHVTGREIYLHLPNGMARTKLTNAYFDTKLATTCTARNWATILNLAEMAGTGCVKEL